MDTTRKTAAAVLCLVNAPVIAGGLDRASQSVEVIFEPGTYMEASVGYVDPMIDGRNVATGSEVDDVAGDYTVLGGAFKFDLSPDLAAALIINEPYGAELRYPSSDPALGGTQAEVSSIGITGLLKYTLPQGISVLGGAQRVRLGGDVTLSGAGYGPISGYQAELSDEWANGYVAGLAFEKPEIALRVLATYRSALDFEARVAERGPLVPVPVPGQGVVPLPILDGTSTERFEIAERWQLEAESGIAPNTLLSAKVRYVKNSDTDISPQNFEAVAQRSLTTYGDTTYYELGLGYRFIEWLAGSVDVFYEDSDDDTFSPLQVTADQWGVGLGSAIDLTERVTLSLGLRHIWFDDVTVSLSNTDLVRFEDHTALAAGAKLGINF